MKTMRIYKEAVCKYLNIDLDTEISDELSELLYEKLIEKINKIKTTKNKTQWNIQKKI